MNRPLKSILFAPGNKPETLAKLPRSAPDGAIIDLEDSVPIDQKATARTIAKKVASTLIAKNTNLRVFIRINATNSNFFNDDISMGFPDGLAGIVIPKLESVKEVAKATDALDAANNPGLLIMAGLETVTGIINSVEITSCPQIRWCYFGAEDYVADLGGIRRSDNLEVLFARSQIAQAARLTETKAFDMVVTNFNDKNRFTLEAELARSMGYTGKLCIHPKQVSLANKAFSPKSSEITWAMRVTEAYATGQSKGQSVITLDGEMIDEPVAKRAQAILDAVHPSD